MLLYIIYYDIIRNKKVYLSYTPTKKSKSLVYFYHILFTNFPTLLNSGKCAGRFEGYKIYNSMRCIIVTLLVINLPWLIIIKKKVKSYNKSKLF